MRHLCLALTLLGLLMTGCQPPAADSAAAAFDQFNQAMQRGDYAAATALVDFDALAAAENSDWASIPKGQRQQITAKMRQDTEAGLRGLGYPSGGMAAAAPTTADGETTIVASGGGKQLTLKFRQGEGGWKITGGVPGMTSQSGMSGSAS